MKPFTIVSAAFIIFTSCNSPKTTDQNLQDGFHKFIVEEVIHTSQYTYIRTTQDNLDQWLAIPGMEVETGSTYYYKGGLLMTNFNSRELERVFEKIIFLEEIFEEPPSEKATTSAPSDMHSGSVAPEKLDITVNPIEGGVTIAYLYSEKYAFAGKPIKIRGQVTKFNPAIMGKNWIHLQDGTDFDGHFDLTVTSESTVEPGETVTFEGVIALDKDFGYGYFYDVLMEEGKIVE